MVNGLPRTGLARFYSQAQPGPDSAPVELIGSRSADVGFQFLVTGIGNRIIRIDQSSDLKSWTEVGKVGYQQTWPACEMFTDYLPPQIHAPRLFYRAVIFRR